MNQNFYSYNFYCHAMTPCKMSVAR